MTFKRLLPFVLPALAFACDPESGDVGDELEPRIPIKGDAPGSCAPDDCGSKGSSGSCWCDDLCVQYGDCCSDKPAVCDGEVEPEPTPTVDPGNGSGGVWAFADVHGVANLDDDDGQYTDWQQYIFGSDDDLSVLTLPASALAGFGPGDSLGLTLQGSTSAVRVWFDGEPLLGNAAGKNSVALDPGGGDIELVIEFGNYNVGAQLRISHLDAAGNELASDVVAVESAPLILNHHLQPAEHVWATSVNAPGYSNAGFIHAYQQHLGSDFTAVSGSTVGNDVWMQDELEFGTSIGDQGQRLDTVVDSIRNRGLDVFPEARLVGPDVIARTWGIPSQVRSEDSFGNLEVSPPVTVGGVAYPFGRIYYGAGLSPQLGDFLESQQVQDPFVLDTSWLCVGHVDEYSTFVPDASSPKGFKLLLADVDSAYALLDQLPGSMNLPRYGADHGYPNVSALRGDSALRNLNEDVQDFYLQPLRAKFKAELGLTEADIIDMPTLFEQVPGCGGGLVALTPGMVNLIVANFPGQTTKLFIPDPFFRSNLFDQDSDPVIQYFTDALPAGLEPVYVDDWDVYHLGLGEVHCGSNVERTPTDVWW